MGFNLRGSPRLNGRPLVTQQSIFHELAHDPNPPLDLEDTTPTGLTVAISIQQATAGNVNSTTVGTLPKASYWKTLTLAFSTSALSGGPTTIDVLQASETDLSQAISERKSKTLGQNTTTEIAQPIGRRKSRAVAQVTETETPQAIGCLKRKILG
jgi:hypothetical protein